MRAPLGNPPGTERLTDDKDALHVWMTDEKETVVSVGRAHLTDTENATVQIRMMATLASHTGQGLGRRILSSLERCSQERMGAQRGWLNARDEAVGFYLACGWAVTTHHFIIDGIGPHTRMSREFTTDAGI